jgi:uncharacterized protein YqeY
MSNANENTTEKRETKPTTLLLVERLRADLRNAMKARQSSAVIALRTMLSTIDNAGAVEVDPSFVPLTGVTKDVPRRELSEEQQLDLLRAEAEGRRTALETYEALGKHAEAEQMRLELEVFARYV